MYVASSVLKAAKGLPCTREQLERLSELAGGAADHIAKWAYGRPAQSLSMAEMGALILWFEQEPPDVRCLVLSEAENQEIPF